MTPFSIKLDSSQSIFDQVVYGATRAILGASLERYVMLEPASQPPMHPSASVSYEALMEYHWRTRGSRRLPPEGEILASYDLSTGASRHDPLYLDAILMGLQAPDYSRITVPALGIYAVPTSPAALMERWYDPDDPAVRQAVAELFQIESQGKAAQMARFDSEIPDSTVLALGDASHWIFVSHESEVLAAMEGFIARLPQ